MSAVGLPTSLSPQLCRTAKHVPEGDGWLYELKYDGYRLLCRKDGSDVRLITRGGHDWTDRLPRLRESVEKLSLTSGWLDGELVFLADDERCDFSALQRGTSRNSAQDHLFYQVWDMPYADGKSLTGAPLIARKERLEAMLGDASGTVRYSRHIVGHGPELFAKVSGLGVEGIVSKRIDSRYHPGRRTSDWLKTKSWRIDELELLGVEIDPRAGVIRRALVGERMPDCGIVPVGTVDRGLRRLVLERLDLATANITPCPSGRKGALKAMLKSPIPVRVRSLVRDPGKMLRHASLV